MRRFLTLLAGLFLSYGLYAGPQDIREKAVEGRGVSTVNDNFRALEQNKLNSRPGDIIPKTGSKYDLGSVAYPFKTIYVDSLTVVGSTAAHASGYLSVNVTNGVSGTDDIVPWDTVESNGDGIFDVATDSITIASAGVYLLSCTLQIGPLGAAGQFGVVSIYKNGTLFKQSRAQVGDTSSATGATVTTTTPLVASDSIAFKMMQNSGSPKDLQGGQEVSYFSVTKMN